jgi:hypothetical protein
MLTGLMLLALVAGAQRAEDRAIAFLSREVPRWPAENQCFSCHNNGDAARALYEAVRRGYTVPKDALVTTTEWLVRPRSWDDNRGDPRFSDRVLARIQFASALASAVEAGLTSNETEAPVEAARLVAEHQQPDGSWQLDTSESMGSPATYGKPLATWAARRSLAGTGDARLQPAIARADRWFREVDVKTLLDAAAVVLGLERASDPEAVRQRRRLLELIARGQAPSGGWGPYLTSGAEPFDTAVVLLALATIAPLTPAQGNVFSPEDLKSAIDRGRRFLLEQQLPDGSWPETTRPPGQQSYAQYISTTGWATLALLATRDP